MTNHCSRSIRAILLVAALLLLAESVTGTAFAQHVVPQTQPTASPSAATSAALRAPAQEQAGPAPKAGAQAGSPTSISNDQALYLVRATLLGLNDANRSGNYTVLRDLAAPDFQARNTAADLAQSFSDLRRRNFDLFAVALLAPQYSANTPALEADGKLRLTGVFATRPLQISFELIFQLVNGHWRLFAISVATPEAPRVQSRLGADAIERAFAKLSVGKEMVTVMRTDV